MTAGCGGSRHIEIRQAWARPTSQGEDAAVYFTLRNMTGMDDEFVGASSTLTGVVEIHESVMVDNVAQMNVLPAVPIVAGEEIVFRPGSLHVALMDIQQGLVLGEEFGITLHFRIHEDMTVIVPVDNIVPADSDTQHDH
jgi:copper(I)-binding protein